MGKRDSVKAPAAGDSTLDNVITRDKSKGTAPLLIIIGIEVILFAVIMAGIITLGDGSRKLQEQLDLGAKYLEEMDYEQALVAFQAALSIEPQNVDAYLGIVEVYIRTNEFEEALKYAKEGYEVTGDERLKEKIDMIESGDIFASNGWVMKMSGYDGAGNLVFWHEYTYNIRGQHASVAKYNAVGEREQYLELAYDEEGRPLISFWYSTLDGTIDKAVRKYDGNWYRETGYEGTGDVITEYREVETDAEDRDLKATWYDNSGVAFMVYMYEYDEDGNLIKQTYYDGNGELEGYDIYAYNEEGRDLGWQSYDADGRLSFYTENVYDEEGNYKGQRAYDADGVLQYEHISQ